MRRLGEKGTRVCSVEEAVGMLQGGGGGAGVMGLVRWFRRFLGRAEGAVGGLVWGEDCPVRVVGV